MRWILPTLALLLSAPALADVKPGDVFRTLDGGTVEMVDHRAEIDKYRAKYREKQRDGDVLTSGEVSGTPTLGGCPGEVEEAGRGRTERPDPDSPTGKEKGGEFRVNDKGRMQQKKEDGTWKTLRQIKAGLEDTKDPDPCGDGTEGAAPGGGGNTTGTLPDRLPPPPPFWIWLWLNGAFG